MKTGSGSTDILTFGSSYRSACPLASRAMKQSFMSRPTKAAGSGGYGSPCRHSTPSSNSAMRSAIESSTGSPPRAAFSRSFKTTRQVYRFRRSAGRCFSTSARTSSSVAKVITSGMTIGCGSGRDQFGRGAMLQSRQTVTSSTAQLAFSRDPLVIFVGASDHVMKLAIGGLR